MLEVTVRRVSVVPRQRGDDGCLCHAGIWAWNCFAFTSWPTVWFSRGRSPVFWSWLRENVMEKQSTDSCSRVCYACFPIYRSYIVPLPASVSHWWAPVAARFVDIFVQCILIILNKSFKNKSIWIIFGTQNPKEILLKCFLICPPYMKNVATVPCEMQKIPF